MFGKNKKRPQQSGCDHDWQLASVGRDGQGVERQHVYNCRKCGESKSVSV